MLGLFIIFALLAIGFAAGYGTRGAISRKRHAEYLNLHPYISPRLEPRQPSSNEGTRTRHAAPEPAMTATHPTKHDITRSFQEISINGAKSAKPPRTAGANLHLVQPHQSELDAASLQPADVEQSLEELVALLLQRRRQEG
jgi:hypothetical protein